MTEALEVSPRGRTGANSDENPGPSGLISRLKAEVALSADRWRTGWPRWARHRLCLARVRWFAIPAATGAAKPRGTGVGRAGPSPRRGSRTRLCQNGGARAGDGRGEASDGGGGELG